MNAPSVDLANHLAANSIGVIGASSGWAIFVSREPDGSGIPDSVITVFDTGGFPANPKFLLDEPTTQVRVRGDINQYISTFSKIQAIKDLLLGLPSQSIGGTFYTGIWVLGDILSLGYDDSNRPILVINFRIIREPASGTNRQAV